MGNAITWDVALRKVLGQRTSSFSLDVRFASPARRLALLGPSGAGKTLSLRMIAGILRPDAGHVALGAQRLFDRTAGIDLPAQQRRLGYVFQDYALFPHLTVRQNIAFARRAGWRNPDSTEADAAAERWIAAFRLGPVAGLQPHQLSGGQRQRTALARALVHEPIALLLDEPFAALDRALRDHLRGELQDLQAELDLPMLLITHDEDDVKALTDDVVPIDAGRVVASPPRAVPEVARA